MNRRNYFQLLLFFSAVIIGGCKSSYDKPKYTSGEANFQRVAAVGGNFLTGYQDGALFLDGQENSVPALMAKQFKAAGGGTFVQPLMPDYTGLGLSLRPWINYFQQRAKLGYYTDCNGDRSLFPLQDPLSSWAALPYEAPLPAANYNNFAVPFAGIRDLMDPEFGKNPSPGVSNPYFARFVSNPGTSSILDDVKKSGPTFFILWTGMEDVYSYAMRGATGEDMVSVAQFSNALDKVLAELCSSGSRGVIANVPDIHDFPFFSIVGPRALTLTQSQSDSLNLNFPFEFSAGNNGFIVKDNSIPVFPYRQMTEDEMVLFSIPLDSVKCNYLGLFPAGMPDNYSLIRSEIAEITQQISDFNTVISAKANKYNIPVCDMHSFFGSLKKGVSNAGAHYNQDFISGGFFSLDGYHPNEKGYGLIANEFIKTINSYYKSNVPLTICKDCKGIRFP